MEDNGLISKKRCSALTWQYYGFKPNANGEPADLTEAICRLCKKKVKVKDAQTTNLRSHIQIHHPAVAASFEPRSAAASQSGKNSSLTPIAAAFACGKKYDKSSLKWTQCTLAVTHFLVKEMVPLSLVDKTEFRSMLQTFDRQYEVPSRNYFSRTAISELYNKVKPEVMSNISSADYVALTTDMWSSSNTLKPYMSIMPESHTADYLADSLLESVKEWHVDERKMSCVTTDNRANFVAAIRQLNWPWLNCFGHNLNVAINNSLQKEKASTDRAFGVCRAINGAFSKSWPQRRELMKAQEELNIPHHSLITSTCDPVPNHSEAISHTVSVPLQTTLGTLEEIAC
ncbi:ZBED1 protein, partial [Amia calva]|nr:ZBED1 protein [Amia calva]